MLESLKRAAHRLSAPAYKLTVDGAPAGKLITGRLISISVVINDGEASDQLSLTIDAKPTIQGKVIELPDTRVKLTLWLGYELRLVKMGIFYVNAASINGSSSGQILTLTAVPSLMINEICQTWANKTIGEIVAEIAERNNLKSVVSNSLKAKKVDLLQQVNESDITFLTHLAEDYHAIVKPISDNLLFLTKGQGRSASSLPLIPVKIKIHDVIQWSFEQTERQAYSSVVARYWDYIQAEYIIVLAGNIKGDQFALSEPFNNEKEAKEGAEAKLKNNQGLEYSLNLTLIGDPDLTAEGTLKIDNLYKKVDSIWIIKSVTHTFSTSGYQSVVQAYRTS